VVVNVQQCSLLHYAILHNEIFPTDIISYDRLKFSLIYTPKRNPDTPLTIGATPMHR